jgi:hypothetical protein
MPAKVNGDTQDEVLAVLLVQEFQNTVKGYLGRTAIQKLCYFAKVLGVPFSFPFRIYYYGPYSEELAFSSDYLVATGALYDASTDPSKYSNFRTGESATELLTHHSQIVKEYRPAIREIVEAFGEFDPASLELLSTMHFVEQRLKARGNKKPTRSQVLREFRAVKGDKFKSNDLDKAFSALEGAGLVG